MKITADKFEFGFNSSCAWFICQYCNKTYKSNGLLTEWEVKKICRGCKDCPKECYTSANTFNIKIPQGLNSNEARQYVPIILAASVATDINHFEVNHRFLIATVCGCCIYDIYDY